MTQDQWLLVKEQFGRALELDSDTRQSLLDTLDSETREAVIALLADAEKGGLLDSPLASSLLPTGVEQLASPLAPEADMPRGPLAGERIGMYRVESLIGRGGMGDVYRARRDDGLFEREVALKVVRADAEAVLARFAVERRILGTLEHPGIARMISAGVEVKGPAAGRPWLALELVEGIPITDATREASLRERVQSLVDVCETVAYAHQRLVVHRDLKPGNVLVTPKAQIKLLDFGIAKLLDGTDSNLTAVHTHRPMTRAYAAPEQLTGGAVTTATDVYGLGLLLFEVLTGHRPFGATTREALEREILDDLPPRPSSLLASGDADRRALRAGLDAICLRALAKTPEARYTSAQDLADDLRRWLDGQPVIARAPSVLYRTRRFLSRHRLPVGIALVALLALAVSAVGFALRVSDAETRASDALADATVLEEAQGEVLRILDPVFRAQEGLTPLAPAPEAVDSVADAIEETFADQPAVLAGQSLELGTTWFLRGQPRRADSLFSRAIELRRASRGDDAVVAQALVGRGLVARQTGDFPTAAMFFREALGIERRLEREEPESLPDDRSTELFLASVLSDAHAKEAALLRALAERQAAAKTTPSENADQMLAQAHNALGGFLTTVLRYPEALREFNASERLMVARWGEAHPALVTLRTNMAITHGNLGAYAEAERIARRALASSQEAGLGDANEAQIRSVIGQLSLFQGDLSDAETELNTALRATERVFGVDTPRSASVLFALGLLRSDQGRTTDAVAYMRRTERIHATAPVPNRPQERMTRAFAEAISFAGGEQSASLERLLVLADDLPSGAANGSVRASILSLAGDALREADRAPEALPLLREALELTQQHRGASHPSAFRIHFALGRALMELDRPQEARVHLNAARGQLRPLSYPSVVPDVDAEIDRLLAK